MEIDPFLKRKKTIQDMIHSYITNNENEIEEKFQNLINFINEDEIKTILKIIIKIANNHHRTPDFFPRIEKILQFLKDQIKQSFSISEILDIFKGNKRILLFLIEENIISINESNNKILLRFGLIQQYFCTNQSNEFKQKQHIGENDNYICNLIRNDLIEEFITYVNKNCIFLSSLIDPSLFETHPFLIKNRPSLIEYSAFFGSTQIFKYLLLNNAQLTPSLCIYAVHGNDAEIIELIIQNFASQGFTINFQLLFNESVKCHHYDMSRYFLENHLQNNFNDIKSSIKYYNFLFFPNELEKLDKDFVFYYLCKYDHCELVDLFLKSFKINVNQKFVLKIIF